MKRLCNEVVRFEDAEYPIEPYAFTDSGGNDIVVQVPEPERHTPHDIYNDPAVHYNVGYAILNYDVRRKGNSRNAEDGERYVYEFNNFYERIDHPKKHTKKNFTLVSVVHFGYGNKNYTATYYDKPKGVL